MKAISSAIPVGLAIESKESIKLILRKIEKIDSSSTCFNRFCFSETYQAKTIGILPMFHIFGIGVVALHTLGSGGRITTLPNFEPGTFLKLLESTKVRHAFYFKENLTKTEQQPFFRPFSLRSTWIHTENFGLIHVQ